MDNKYEVLSDVEDIDNRVDSLIKSESLPSPEGRDLNVFMKEVESINCEVTERIKDCSLITPKDLEKLKKAQAFCLSTYTDVRQYRPMTHKITSVLTDGRFPTADAKYWQAKAEAEVHFNELQRDYFKYERALTDLEELDYKITYIQAMLKGDLTPVDSEKYDPHLIAFDLKRLQVKRAQYEFEIKQLEKTIKYRIEEVTDWHNIAQVYEEKCEYSTTNPNEHIPNTHIKALMYQVQNAETDELKSVFKDQLLTFHRLIKSTKEKEV